MIKTIPKIDLQGNETLQEVVICNRCKTILAPEDYYYTFKRVAWHPVKMKPGTAYGFAAGSNDPWHICEKCHVHVVAVLDGDTYFNSNEFK